MNILWIEDFGGTLSSGTETLESMFKGLLSFDEWDEDSLNLIKSPQDLENFCKQQNSQHCIYLCRNYFDYVEFKANYVILNEIDAVILDIRLDNKVDFSLAIPDGYNNISKFHEEAGFYIFNDLIHLGVPKDFICFMTGEDSTFGKFQERRIEIYAPEIKCFEKRGDAKGYDKLRMWLQELESDYIKLRRGIIEACQYLKTLTTNELPFNKVINKADKKFAFEDIVDYINVLESFLPLREPTDKFTEYKLFIRTLTHEWEATDPKQLSGKRDEFYAFASIMKMTRNWIAHNSTAIFNGLTEQDVAYLFICNMRAIFNLGHKVQNYEKNLCPLLDGNSQETLVRIQQNQLPLVQNYIKYFNELSVNKNHHHIDEILNALQNDKQKIQEKGYAFFVTGLYQLFWFLTSSEENTANNTAQKHSINSNQVVIARNYLFKTFDYEKTEFLAKFSRHIYHRSF